jgi:hypothetical protein
MWRTATITIAAIGLLNEVQAQRYIAPPKPYEPIAVTLPEASADGGLDAFRLDVVKAAGTRIYAELAALVVGHGFFWGRDFSRQFDPHRPGVDNLAAALRLEHDNGAGWRALAALAAESRVTPLESRPGVVCAPGAPVYDGIALDRLVIATRTDAAEWAYLRSADVALRAAPDTNAAAIEMLGLHFIRTFARDGPARGQAGWTRVVTPSGRIGFVAPGALQRLNPARLCYGKDAADRWRIVGYIGGSD